MTPQSIVVADDTRIDRLARALYGSENGGTVEALLRANPGLAGLGGLVPAGRKIAVPVVAEIAAPAVRPWL